MAEGGGIEGLLDSEPDEREGGVAGADAVALSLAMQKAAHDPELGRTAAEYLVQQRHLVQLQIKHFDEERRLAIAAAKRKRYADRIRNTLSTLAALIVLGLILAIIRITLEAFNDYSVVVEGLTVPSELAAQGTTGQALADNLVGRLAAIRSTVNRHSFSSTAEVRGNRLSPSPCSFPVRSRSSCGGRARTSTA
jgi:hypothetical protein